MISRSLRLASVALIASLMLISARVAEGQILVQTLLDLDGNAASGCTVPTAEGDFDGVEGILTTVVDPDAGQVGPVEFESCDGGSFGAPQEIDPGVWPLGWGLGTAASDVVESLYPLSTAAHSSVIRFGVITCSPEDPDPCTNHTGSDDALLTSASGPMLLVLRSTLEIPTAGQWGLLTLALLLALAAFRLLRTQGSSAATSIAVLLLLGLTASVAWAAVVLDGDPSDWAGISPVGSDPAGDAPGTDLLDVFATVDGGLVSFRFDVVVPADAVDDAFVVANNATVNVNVLENDSGPPPLNVVSFGDSLANVGVTPADGATTLPVAAGGGTIDFTIDAAGALSVDANGTMGTGAVSIFYEMQAANSSTDTARVDITFGDLATAVDDTEATLGSGNEYRAEIGVTLNIAAGTGLLNNDTLGSPAAMLNAWGGGDASAAVDLPPGTARPFAGGTLTVNADGSFDLVNPTTSGTYTFDYLLENAMGSTQATVEIHVGS